MNAGPDALEGSGLLVKPNFEALALQQSGRSGSAKSGPDDGNSGCALHEINILDKSLIGPQTKQVLASASDARNQPQATKLRVSASRGSRSPAVARRFARSVSFLQRVLDRFEGLELDGPGFAVYLLDLADVD